MLFRTYGRYVATIGLRILGQRDELEDFVQDVFIEAHHSLGTLQHSRELKAWVATIAVRTARRRLKRRRLLSALGFASEACETVADANATPEARAMVASMYRLLARVPTDARIAWTLRHIEGEQLETVAELCGCSLATAKRRIASAQAVLAQEFTHD